ncbi:MAG: alanine--glyoxylate aminotransferase family protein [Desulfovibrionaceae bacterium]|nr:alanine--glyoxylate aminotransferase family protein [Desulfovibrionaceae bacterium]MBF0512594.1 alanine--glyoxylate aminotransferase family protein [Desulfovibrionaceae bacterium]
MLNKLRLLTPGPTPLPEEVRLAMARDMVHHRKAGFKAVLAEVQEGLKALFGTAQPVLPLTCSGTGAMDAAVSGLFSPGEKVLVVEAGKFGQRFTQIARRRGLLVAAQPLPWGQAADPAMVRYALEADKDIVGVLMQASETSTGVLHPVREVATVTKSHGALLVVDGISAVGVSPLPMDEWGVDCLLTGSQKGLMLPPGLAFLALSEKAWERAAKAAPGSFYFDLAGELANLKKHQTLFTPAVSLIAGLQESLRLFKAEGLEAVYRKQWALTLGCRAGARALGLDLFAPKHFAWGLTSVALPEGVDGVRLVQVAAEKYGVVMAGGQDQLKGRIVRVGHMGHVDFGDLLAGLHAFNRSFAICGGFSACDDYLERAMAAYEEALEQGYPAL